MSAIIDQTVEELKKSLPPVFAGMSLDERTADAIPWRTIQNARSRREIPSECFIYSGRKVLVRRDPFLDWWRGTLRTVDGKGAPDAE